MLESHVSDGVCTLQLNCPPLNTLRLDVLEELTRAVQHAAGNAQVRGLILTGGPQHFSAGADLKLFDAIRTGDDAVRISRVFQEAFQKVEDCGKPVVAMLSGSVLGGALELAMACHYRVATEATWYCMPEINLAINPGAGGTQRLPRLIGPGVALQMLLTAQRVSAREALEWGLIDCIGSQDEILAWARERIRSGGVRATLQRTDRLGTPDECEQVFRDVERSLGRFRPELIAPRMVFDTVQVGIRRSVEAGMRAEQMAFAACMGTLAARNKIYLFLAGSQTGKIAELVDLETVPINRTAVIGMGSMGTGIAHALMLGGFPVTVVDQDRAALDRGVAKIRGSLERRVEQGQLAAHQMEQVFRLVSTTTDWQQIADCELVIESVFEEVAVKQAVLATLEEHCSETAIIATNTSTISLAALAEPLDRPDRFIGMHFFNPAHRMPLLEVIRHARTSPAIVATLIQCAKKLRKTPILVEDREGFLVNRLFVPYLQEAFHLLEEGAAPRVIDAAAIEFGFPMGPFVLIDMAGIDILVHAHRILQNAFPCHGPLSLVASRLMERGCRGQKDGRGVYRYEPGNTTPLDNDTTLEILGELRQERRIQPREIDSTEITMRLVLRMVCEAFRVMEEGIVRRAADVDVATVQGVGFPDFRGGVLKYAMDLGTDQVLSRLDFYTEQHGERFAPCQLLREPKGIRSWRQFQKDKILRRPNC